MSSSSNKLHPIYVALDSHQYSRAVKLASALPPSNLLGKALLAHALLKSGALQKALVTIKQLLWFDSVELNYEIQRLSIGESGSMHTSSDTTSSAKQHQPKSKKGGKNKRTKAATPTPSTTNESPSPDLIHHLTTPLELPPEWLQGTIKPNVDVITDQTILDTIAVTLQALRLYTTQYQLFAHVTPPTLETLLKSYTCGLYILAHSSRYSSFDTIQSLLLAAMQVTALQLSRGNDNVVVRLWAPQTATWQLQFCGENLDTQKLEMLPRLASSLAQKYKLTSSEAYLLYMDTLQDDYQTIVTELLQQQDDILTSQQRLQLLANAHEQLKEWEAARLIYQDLLKLHSDQWEYWKHLLHTSFREVGFEQACQILENMLEATQDDSAKYPCRARHLIQCELAALKIRDDDPSEEDATALQTAIVAYGNEFGPRASCAYSDLAPYIQLLLETSTKLDALLEWSHQLWVANQNSKDRSMLRCSIFATQVTYKILSFSSANNDDLMKKWLPDWKQLVTEWRASQALGTAKEGEDVQKENQPGDELVLLAVQNLLHCSDDGDDASLLMSASLLEEALQNSPYNAYLKIAAMDVYARLNAVHRAWELFQGLAIKHIQLDSCSYLILSKLVDGGLYNEAIQVSNEVLKFHGATARDTGEYTVQAMEHGTLSKATEFLNFQRNRMDSSLTLRQAKGHIMDCAPLVFLNTKKQSIGMSYGIAGKETDLARASEMVREVHNPFGAPNAISEASTNIKPKSVSDNRDLSILSFEILQKSTIATKDELVLDSIRRGLLHGLLVRLTLCVDATKGPKKGKVVKPSDQLQNRCVSLLDVVDQTTQFVQNADMETCYKEGVEAMLVLCRVVAMVSAGMPKLEGNQDTLASREQYAAQQLESIALLEVNWSVPSVCRFLPDVLVPLSVVVRMTANLFALYGWGKRKCHTRASAGALAKLAQNLKVVVESMKNEMKSLPGSDEDRTNRANELLSLVGETERLNETSTESVCHRVSAAQQLTRQRVMPFLDEVLEELSSFEEEEA